MAKATAKQQKQQDSKELPVEAMGQVTEALPNLQFKVQLENSEAAATCTLSGKIRSNNIKVIVGDKVAVELSAYDLTKGRIVFRYKS